MYIIKNIIKKRKKAFKYIEDLLNALCIVITIEKSTKGAETKSYKCKGEYVGVMEILDIFLSYVGEDRVCFDNNFDLLMNLFLELVKDNEPLERVPTIIKVLQEIVESKLIDNEELPEFVLRHAGVLKVFLGSENIDSKALLLKNILDIKGLNFSMEQASKLRKSFGLEELKLIEIEKGKDYKVIVPGLKSLSSYDQEKRENSIVLKEKEKVAEEDIGCDDKSFVPSNQFNPIVFNDEEIVSNPKAEEDTDELYDKDDCLILRPVDELKQDNSKFNTAINEQDVISEEISYPKAHSSTLNQIPKTEPTPTLPQSTVSNQFLSSAQGTPQSNKKILVKKKMTKNTSAPKKQNGEDKGR